MAQRNAPWRYADTKLLRENQAERFRKAAQDLGRSNVDTNTWDKLFGGQTANQLDQKYQPPQKKKGGGLFGRLAEFGADVRDTAGDVAHGRFGDAFGGGGDALSALGSGGASTLEALGFLKEKVGKPAMGVLTGASGMERKPIYDADGNIVGYKREGGQGLFDWAGNVAESIRHPVRAGQAFNEYEQSLPWVGQVAAETAADPLSWVGPGAAKAIIPGSSKAATVARNLIDQGGGKMVLGGAYGGAGAAKLAQDAGVPDELITPIALAGGIGGGLSAAKFARFGNILSRENLGRALAQEAPAMGMSGPWKTKGGQKTAAGFKLEPPPEGEYVFPHSAKLDPAETKARVKHYLENNYEESAPANPDPVRLETSRGTYYAGRKSPTQWEEETASVLSPDEIRAAGSWYRDLYGEFEKRYGPERAPQMLDTYLASQVNVTVEGGMTNTMRAVDKAQGLAGDKVGGTSRPHEAALIAEYKGEAPIAFKSDKIWDFMDSARGKTTRTYMGNDPRAGQPFAGDVHQARDAGYIDPTTAVWIEKETGKTLDELGLKQDFPGSAKPDDTQYQWLSKWGNNLVQDLNAKNWMGRSDWRASDIQAIGWMKFRKLLGAEGGTIEDAFKANTRRVSIEAAPGTGSRLEQLYGDRLYALPEAAQKQVTEELMDRLAESISRETGNPVTRAVSDTGFWGDYPASPSYQWDVVASPEGAQDVVNLAAYVAQQTEVLGHRFKPSSDVGGVRFKIEGATPQQVEQFYREMRANTGIQGAAPTGDGLVTLDVDKAWGKNGTRAYESRRDGIIAEANAVAQRLGIEVGAYDYPVEVLRAQNDWGAVPDGRSHLQGLVARGGRLPELANQLSSEYEQWFDEALRRAESGGQPAGAEALQRGAQEGQVGRRLFHGMRDPFEGNLQVGTGTNSTVFGNEPVQRSAAFLSDNRDVARDFGSGGVAEFTLNDGTRIADLTGGVTPEMEARLIRAGMNPRLIYSATPLWELLDDPEVVDVFRRAGFEGVAFPEAGPSGGASGNTYALFNPDQSLTRLALDGSTGTFRDVTRGAYGGTPVRAAVQAGAAAVYGATNPGEEQGRGEAALSAALLSLARSYGIDPRILKNAIKAKAAAGQQLTETLPEGSRVYHGTGVDYEGVPSVPTPKKVTPTQFASISDGYYYWEGNKAGENASQWAINRAKKSDMLTRTRDLSTAEPRGARVIPVELAQDANVLNLDELITGDEARRLADSVALKPDHKARLYKMADDIDQGAKFTGEDFLARFKEMTDTAPDFAKAGFDGAIMTSGNGNGERGLMLNNPRQVRSIWEAPKGASLENDLESWLGDAYPGGSYREADVGDAHLALSTMRDGTIYLEDVRSLKPGSNDALKAVAKLTELADRHGARIELLAQPLEAMNGVRPLSGQRLVELYERFGFQRVYPDDALELAHVADSGVSMVREPRAPRRSLLDRAVDVLAGEAPTAGLTPGVRGPRSGATAKARQQLGQVGADLFGLESAQGARSAAASYLASARGRIDQGLREAVSKAPVIGKLDPNLVKDTDVAPFVVKARNAIQNRISSYEGYADHLMGRLEDAGVNVELGNDGQWYVKGTPVAFGDMAERSTPAGAQLYASLKPAQRQAVDDLQAFNQRLNDNLQFHGKMLPFDPDTGAAYFPRLVKGKNGIEKAYVGSGGGPGLTSSGNFMQERVMASLDEGIANNVNYAHPREAYRAMVRAKLRVAGDSYVAEALRPLGKTADQLQQAGGHAGFNYVQLPPNVAPQLQGVWFPREVAERIVGGLTPKGAGALEKFAKPVNAVLTPMRAVADISWYLQQGGAMMFRHPLKANAGAIAVIKSALGDATKYRNLLDSTIADGAARAGMSPDEYTRFLVSKGLHFTPDDLGGDVIAFKGTTGGTSLPVAKQARQGYQAVGRFSNETFSRYLNYARFVLANDAVETAMKGGTVDQLDGALAAVNRMTGQTGRTPTQLESIFEFAPKFFSAAVEQTAAAVSKGGMEGAIARRHIGTMLGVAAFMTAAANAARGYDTDFDPRSNNFLRLRNVGGLDVSLLGTYDTFFRAIAGTAAGASGESPHPDIKRLWRLAEGKMSPALAAVYYPFVKGSTYNGEPLDPLGSWEGAARTAYEYGKSVVPFSAQGYIEQGLEPAIRQGDPSKLASGLVQEVASGTGLTNSPVTPTENRNFARDAVARKLFGAGYDSLEGAQKAQVNEDQKVSRFQKEADRNTLTQASDRSSMTKLQLESSAQIDELSKELEAGQISGNDFRDQLQRINDQLRGARKVLEQSDRSGVLGGWFDLYDQAAMPDGRTDYEKLDSLQADYRAKHPEVDQKLLQAVGAHDNATMREYRQAQKLAQQYYSIPAYKGLSLEQSQRAGRALSAAQAAVTYGQVRTMRQAIAMIARQDPETAKLMRIAQNRGSNPERKKFRKANPLLAKFYSDVLAA